MGADVHVHAVFQNQCKGIERWMEELDVFLHAPDPATGDVASLTAHLSESNVRSTHTSTNHSCHLLTTSN